MKRLAFASLLLVALGACGVDGAPERPDSTPPPAGLSMSGTVEIGVVGSP